jgi:integrase
MGNVRVRPETGLLFLDFRFAGKRLREQTTLPNTPANVKRLNKVMEKIEQDIALGTFDYAKTFGKELVASAPAELQATPTTASTPLFREFAEQWFLEVEVTWRRSYKITQRGVLDKYLLPHFGDKPIGCITKAEVLELRSTLTKHLIRKGEATLSNRRVNAIMKPLRQILNEGADRYNFTSSFRNIKPLKIKRSDVMPFSIEEVQTIIATVRDDYKNYFKVRFFTGMRTGEVHGLKWKHIDFERRLILVRESLVLQEEEELKTDSSIRDIHMSQIVYDALKVQWADTGDKNGYVFCNRAGQPINNTNFINRVWAPLLRFLDYAPRKAYQMRHTAATLWLASGEAPEWIARQLGHSTTEMLFRVYSRYVPNLTRNDGSAMERMLAQHMNQSRAAPKLEPGDDGVFHVSVDRKTQHIFHAVPMRKST